MTRTERAERIGMLNELAKALVSTVRSIETDFQNREEPRSPKWRFGVEWIALNDEPTERDPEAVASLISVALLADLFGKTTEDVAKAVLQYRKRHL